jgi:hypothetical protein
MQFVVWVETIIAGQSVAVQRAAVVECHCLASVPTKLGLTLQEGRATSPALNKRWFNPRWNSRAVPRACASTARVTAHQGY